MTDLFDIDGALLRLKTAYGVNKDKNIAALLKLSPQDFSNRKKRGTLIEPIVKWGVNENVDLNWLLTGKKFDAGDRSPSDPKSKKKSIPLKERRITPQNPREGIISLFEDSDAARQMILNMADIEKLDHDQYLMLTGEIRGTARALKPKKKA